jgi:AcrR family transcriptional regulator
VRALVEVGGLPADVAAFLRELQPELVFLLDDLAATTEESLDARCLSAVATLCLRFLQFVRAAPRDDAVAMIVGWEGLLTRLLAHPRKREALLALFSWFAAGVPPGHHALQTIMVSIHDPETRNTMKSELDELLEEGFEKGLAQGREDGHLSGQREMLRHLLAKRFGAIPVDVDARVRAATAADVEAWGERMLTATSLADVFGR